MLVYADGMTGQDNWIVGIVYIVRYNKIAPEVEVMYVIDRQVSRMMSRIYQCGSPDYS